MSIVKKNILLPVFAVIMTLCLVFGSVDAYALFSINPTVRTGYSVYVDGDKTDAKYIATYSNTVYVPLNQIAYDLGMQYSVNGSMSAFAYEDTMMSVDYATEKVYVNNLPYNLQFGTIKKTIGGQQYLFFNIKDIQNVFGIVTTYDEVNQKIDLNTGFGIMDISYELSVNSMIENQAKQKLLDYANNIADKTGCVISEDNANAYGSLNSLFTSLNTPITRSEYVNGIAIKGVNVETTQTDDIKYLMNLKFLVGLSKLTVVPEYFGGYKLSNGESTVQVVGAFYDIDGIDISNVDLGVAAVATIEDAFGVSLSQQAATEIQNQISVTASSARVAQHYIIAVIQNGNVKVVDVF